MKTKFKKTLVAFAFLLVANFVMAQAPQGIPYQAVARDNAGNLIKNQNIALRFKIHDGTANGAVVYSETHSVTTDALGLFAVKIGGGTSSGTFANINWGSGAKFTQVALDVTGGSNFIDMGTTQMMSVPYALYAANANVPGVPGPQGPTGPTGATGSVGSVTAISGTSNPNGATISGGNLTLTPASATNGGIVTNGTQTFAGNKTFTGTTTANSFVKTGGTASQYLMADGSTTQTIRGRVNANGTIAAGSGFTIYFYSSPSNTNPIYIYSIYFSPPFQTPPIVVATPENSIGGGKQVIPQITDVTANGFMLRILDLNANAYSGAMVDLPWSFIAMAP